MCLFAMHQDFVLEAQRQGFLVYCWTVLSFLFFNAQPCLFRPSICLFFLMFSPVSRIPVPSIFPNFNCESVTFLFSVTVLS